jgi:isopenicillin-N epimerase
MIPASPEALRELFLLDPDLIFLNHGSFGAVPREVLEVCHGWQREMERNPVAFLGRRSAELLLEARRALAEYLGADPSDLVFVSNATVGVNTVARSLPLREGDEILTTDHEYGACDATWDFVCRRGGARVRRVPIPLPFDAGSFAERVWSAVTPRTRVLFLSHITSTTALIFPLQELCRRARAAGILTLIDGAHAPGQIPLDLEALGADFYTGNCHKWLCAPKGAAFLHARPEHHDLLDGLTVSWGYSDQAGNESYTGSRLLERRQQWQGTRDLSAFLSVPAALDFQRRQGWDQVRRDCHARAARTLARAATLTGLAPVCREDDFAQMGVIPMPVVDPADLKATLYDRYHIEIPVTSHQDRRFLRLSVAGYTTDRELDGFLDALGRILGR